MDAKPVPSTNAKVPLLDIAMPFATFLDAAVPDPVIVKVSPPCKASKLLNVEPADVVVASYCLARVAFNGRWFTVKLCVPPVNV